MGRGIPSLRDAIGNLQNSRNHPYHWAVKDVSFELHPGESLGIIGPNGAGKTTILKLLSRVTQPTSGEIRVHGRFSALIELGAGFHPDLTGRENIYLNATILGMRKAETRVRFDQIVDFSGIELFLDTPVKRYSSGMYARLGFAIAAHVNPDVLLVDEVLAVGDYAFRMKCYEQMYRLRTNGASLIFVSHNMEDVRRVCDKGLVMFNGEKAYEGTAIEAVAEYANVLRRNADHSAKSNLIGSEGLAQRRMTLGAKVENVELIGEDGGIKRIVKSGETIYVQAEIQFFEDAESPVFAITLHGDNGEVVYDTTTRVLGITSPNFQAGDWVTVRYKLDIHLLDGVYNLATDLAYSDLSCYYDYVANALSFVVVGGSRAKGVADLKAEISFSDLSVSNQPHIRLISKP
jgi:lipopolysaccharide transport system ATP-binding protein